MNKSLIMDDSTILRQNPPSTALRRHNSIATSVVVPKKPILPATQRWQSCYLANPNGGASATTPTNTRAPPASLLDLELVPLKSSPCSYTSLKDVLPSSPATAINSPSTSSAITNSGYEISIRNRLVKQAAWAYLRPMYSSPDSSSGTHFLLRLWRRFSSSPGSNPFSACVSFINGQIIPGIARVLDWMLRAIRGHVGR